MFAYARVNTHTHTRARSVSDIIQKYDVGGGDSGEESGFEEEIVLQWNESMEGGNGLDDFPSIFCILWMGFAGHHCTGPAWGWGSRWG